MSASLEIEENESWEYAKRFACAFGEFPPLFTAAIRAIRCAPKIIKSNDLQLIKKFSRDAIIFPIKVSPTFKSCFFAFAEESNEAGLALINHLTLTDLIDLFSPDEMSAAVALIFLHRFMKRRCPDEEWDRINHKLSAHLKIGYRVGKKIDNVGGGNGMFMAGLRILAQSFFLHFDEKGFKELRRFCEKKNYLFSPDEERKRWGCDHLQIASHLASLLGYGIGPRLAFGMYSSTSVDGAEDQDISENSELISKWRICMTLTEAFHAHGTAQRGLFMGQHVTSQVVTELESVAREAVVQGSGFDWINRKPGDLPTEIASFLGISTNDMASVHEE
jgi:hypothetical protein